MKTSDFYYDLPENLIAQKPLEHRDYSRLMVLDKSNGNIKHDTFYNIIDYLKEGDCLVLNDSRVLPARIYGTKEDTGSKVEILLLSEREPDVWEILVKPGKKAKIGTVFNFNNKLKAEILDIKEDGNRLARFEYIGSFYALLDEIGVMPLPPYIKEQIKDRERYQTVYSKDLGSVAAPTAGLHFTKELLEKIKDKGVNIAYVTLHVGLGTFRPVKVDNITEHKMHSEYYTLDDKNAKIINTAKQNGKRVIAVGTTSCRTLESIATRCGKICKDSGNTDIFIYPGYTFKCIDALITNFHLPESTLIMLVSAFAGYDNIMSAYKEAVAEKYRFFSFGDSMLIK